MTKALDEAWGEHQAALARLREVEHWRRLVAARLDLAVAAVTDIDDLSGRLPTLCAGDLRHLLGVRPHEGDAGDETRLDESGRLVGLRAALGELDAYLEACRLEADASARCLSQAMAGRRPELTITLT